MITSKHKPVLQGWRRYRIKKPKYSTDSVILARAGITEHNLVRFIEDERLGGDWYINRKQVEKYPVKRMSRIKGGSIDVYEVPLKELERLDYYEDIFSR